MAEKIISPGVFSKEIDASFLPAVIGNIGAVVVGPTVKGPALVPTVINSYAEYQAKFGDVFKSGSNYYQYLTSMTAKNYLKHSGKMTVVRIMGAGYSHASATISSSIDPAIVGGGIVHTGSITLVGGHLSSGSKPNLSASFTPYGGSKVDFIFTGSLSGTTDSATQIYVLSGSSLAGSAAALRNAINISSSLHNLPISASLYGTKVGISASIAGAFGVIGGSSITTNTPTTIYGGSGINNYVNLTGSAWPKSGSIHTENLTGGTDFNSNAFKIPFKLHTLADGDILNNSASIGTNSILTDGSQNNIRWEIGSLNKNKGTFSLLIRRGDDTIKRKQIMETWNNMSLDPNQSNYIAKMIGDQDIAIGGTADDPYLTYTGDWPNKSKYVRVEVLDNTFDYLNENGNIRVNAASASLPTFYSGSNSGSGGGAFSGGSDGTISHPILFNENIVSTNTQGFNLNTTAVKEQYTKALNLLSNDDEYDFNLLLLPGIIRNLSDHTSVITKAIDVCEARGDAFVIVDSVDYSVTNLGTVTDQAKVMDSNYAATYWPWVQVSDQQIGTNVWVPPSVVMSGIYAFNDKVAAPWFAPAGLNRGSLDTVVQAARKLTHANRDTLYDSNVNPIATFPGQGVVVWGQKTLQKKSSALDRVNVRRLMIKVKKFIAASSRFLVFEQNNATTRNRFLNIANPYLEQVQAQSGLNAFKVVMDDTNNTPDIVDRNILYGQIFLQPTKTAEFIVLDFTIQPTGATFPE